MSFAATSLSSFTSHKLKNLIYVNHHQHRSSSSHGSHVVVVVGGLPHLPCRNMMNIHENKHGHFLLSSSTYLGFHYLFGRSLQPSERSINMQLNATENPVPTPPPSRPPPSGWFNWILWTVLPMILPFFKNKWGPLLAIKKDVNAVIETVESAAEIMEEVAEEVEKIAEDAESKLPEGGLKDAISKVEHVAEEAIRVSDLAEDLLHKAQEAEKKMEDLMEKQSSEAAMDVQAQKLVPPKKS